MNKLQYLRGDDLIFENGLVFKHPSLGDLIKDDTANKFYTLANLFTTRSIDNIGLLVVEVKVDNPFEYDDYNLFIELYNSDKHYYQKCFEFVCGISDFEIGKINNDFYLYSEKTKVFINKTMYEQIDCFFTSVLFIKKDNLYKNSKGNKASRMIIDYEVEKYLDEKSKREKNKDNQSKKNELNDILVRKVGALVSISNYGINYQNVFDLKLYQFNDLIRNYDNQISYRNTITGLYANGIDSKNIDVKKLSWILQE